MAGRRPAPLSCGLARAPAKPAQPSSRTKARSRLDFIKSVARHRPVGGATNDLDFDAGTTRKIAGPVIFDGG